MTFRSPILSAILLTGLAACSAGEPASAVVPVEQPPVDYVTQRHLPCLGTTVTLTKSPRERTARFPDGTTMSIDAAMQKEEDACFAQRGVLSERLANEIAAPGGKEKTYAFGLVYTVLLDATPEQFDAKRVDVRRLLEGAGILNARGYDDPIPMLTGHATGAQLWAIAFDPLLSGIVEDDAGPIENHVLVSDPVSASQADTAFLSDGYGGDGERIGVIDPGGCLVRDTHQVFAGGGVEYQAPGQSHACTNDGDCITACDGGEPLTQSKCTSGKCVDGHGHWVSSVVAQVAPRARILYTNGNFAKNLAPLPEMMSAYTWLAGQKARFVVQSFRANEQFLPTGRNDSQGIVEDQYARREGWFIAQSAGNGGYDPIGSVTNEACPWSINAMCVGSHRIDGTVSCFSSWLNPGGNLLDKKNFPDTDREEPDILALGGNGVAKTYSGPTPACTNQTSEHVSLASSGSNNGYTDSLGTSFSTPIVGASAALVHQYCAKLGVELDGLELRNTLMLTAVRNARDWNYSTLKPGTDAFDGAGNLTLNAARAACDSFARIATGNGPAAVHGNGTVDTSVRGEPLPVGDVAYQATPPGVETRNQGLNPVAPLLGTSATPEMKWQRKAGEHIRFVLSWNACSETKAAPNRVGVDFDVFLYSPTVKKYLYTSQSNDDNNEGFDVVVPPGWDGEFIAYVAHPDGAKGCKDSPMKERFTWSSYE